MPSSTRYFEYYLLVLAVFVHVLGIPGWIQTFGKSSWNSASPHFIAMQLKSLGLLFGTKVVRATFPLGP